MITRHLNVPHSSVQQAQEKYMIIQLGIPNTALDNSIRVTGTGPCSILSHEMQDRTVARKDSALYQQRNLQAMELKLDVETKSMQVDNELGRLRAREKFLYVFMEASLSSKQPSQVSSSPTSATATATATAATTGAKEDTISRAKTLDILINEKVRKLNGKLTSSK